MGRKTGNVLIATGALVAIGAPAGFTLLAAYGCGMNTTGCPTFHFPWNEALRALAIPELLCAGTIWLGFRLRARS